MRDCPGEDVEGVIEDAFIAAEEERLKERPYLHQMMAIILDREKLESKTLRDLGNKIYPYPPLKLWNVRVVSPKERERSIGEPTEMEKFKKDMVAKLKRRTRMMSECGRIIPPRSHPRRCSQKPKTENWLGRRRSRARAVTLVRRVSDGGALRGSSLLQRGSVFMDHKRESMRRATMRRQTVLAQQTGLAMSKIEAVKTLTGTNMDNVVDMSIAVQNVTDSLNKMNAEFMHKQAWGKISPTEYTSDPFYDWKIYKSDMPYTKFGRTEDYLQSNLSSYKNAIHGLPT